MLHWRHSRMAGTTIPFLQREGYLHCNCGSVECSHWMMLMPTWQRWVILYILCFVIINYLSYAGTVPAIWSRLEWAHPYPAQQITPLMFQPSSVLSPSHLDGLHRTIDPLTDDRSHGVELYPAVVGFVSEHAHFNWNILMCLHDIFFI